MYFRSTMMTLNSAIAVLFVSTMLFARPALGEAEGVRTNDSGEALSRPRVIYVGDFAIEPGLVQASSDLPSEIAGREGGVIARLRERGRIGREADSTNPEIEARQAVDQLAESIVSAFRRAGIPAERIAAGTVVPADCWLLRGQFEKLSEGNRVQQSVVGFGAGQPEVQVSGAVVATQSGIASTVLTFGEESQQHHMPGGIVTRNPYVIAAKFVLSRGATGRDVQQLGASLATEIMNSMRTNGLIN
jgi:Domain of unknown function (DUF4410)